MMPAPLHVDLEFARAEQAGDPYAFRFTAQDYLLRGAGGGFESARLSWDAELLADLQAVRLPGRDPVIAQRLGEALRRFLFSAGWAEHEAQILEAVRAQRPIFLTLRSAAAELYALPWELVTIKSTGQHLGELPGLLVRYEWPETTSLVDSAPSPAGGRILFAWSAAGGAVPAAEQLAAIESACQAGFHPFEREGDVLADLSLGRLVRALATAQSEKRPIAVLHLLCHGAAIGSTFGLSLNGEAEGDGPVVVDAGRLRQILSPYASMLKLVVLCACDGGNSGALGNQLGSVAQTLHRAGIAAVVASRYPLSIAGSIRLTESIYTQLLGQLSSLERALPAARLRLAEDVTQLDWASGQFYARAADGDDTRPVQFRPYRGLLAFQSTHRRFFFGRDSVVAEICSDLAALKKNGKPRFLVVAGASGTGKSSAVLAGAVPKLLAATPTLRFIGTRPGEDLEAVLKDIGTKDGGTKKEGPLLLVIDQFEEIFTHSESAEKRQALVRRLWQLAGDASSEVSIIVTLRVDFIGRCGEIVLDEAGTRLDTVAYDEAHRIFVPQMEQSSLRAAIESPAQLVGLHLEEGLAQRMLSDVSGEPGALPLLEDTLDLLWQRRSGRTLTQAAYDEVGGVAGALHGRADALIDSLDEEDRRLARRLLVRLCSVAEDLALSTRRRVPLSRLRPSADKDALRFDRLLSQLVDARLLVRDGQGAAQMVEVAHEALIRKWPRLGEWVQADRQMLARLEKLEAWTREWNDTKTLLVGEQLISAESVRKDYKEECSEEALALIDASQIFAKRRQRVRKWTLRVIVGAALIMSMLGWFALSQAALVNREVSATRDVARLSAVRSLGDSPLEMIYLLREVESEDPLSVIGWRQAAIDLLRDIARLEDEWTVNFKRGLYGPALSPDCVHFAIVEDKTTISVQGKQGVVGSIKYPESFGKIMSMALSPDARTVATVSKDRTLRLWPVDGTTAPVVLPSPLEEVSGLSFSPDGRQIFGWNASRQVWVWQRDGKSGPTLRVSQDRDPHGPISIRDRGWDLAIPTYAEQVQLYNETESRGLLFDRGNSTTAAFMCNTANRMVTWNAQAGTFRLWTLGQAPSERGLFTLPYTRARHVRFSPDGKKLVVMLRNGAQIWNSDGTGGPLNIPPARPSLDVMFSPDGKKILVKEATGPAQIWNTDLSGAPVDIPASLTQQTRFYFSPDSRMVAVLEDNRRVKLFRTETGEALLQLDPQLASIPTISSLVFSPDGKKIGAVSSDHTVYIWNTSTSGAPQVLHLKGDTELAFSEDGRRVYTTAPYHGLQSRELDDLSKSPTEYLLPWRRFLFSADSRRIAGFTTQESTGIFFASRTATAEKPLLLGSIPDTTLPILSGDGSRLVVHGIFSSSQVVAWSTEDAGQKSLMQSDGLITTTELSFDGKKVALMGTRGVPIIWDLEHHDELEPARLQKQLWEVNATCSIALVGIEAFNPRTIQASVWDQLNCMRMQKCFLTANPDKSNSRFLSCRNRFRVRQHSWFREWRFQKLYWDLVPN